MEEEGFEVNWFMLDQYGVPTNYEGVFVTNDDMIENDSAALEGFLRACAKGFADMQADPEEALRILLDNQNEENFPLSETVERQSMETLLPLMETADARFLSQTEECWQKNIDWLYDSGLIQTRVEPAQVMAELDWRK